MSLNSGEEIVAVFDALDVAVGRASFDALTTPGADRHRLSLGDSGRYAHSRRDCAAGQRLTWLAAKAVLIALARPPMQISCSSPTSSTGQATPAKTMTFVR